MSLIIKGTHSGNVQAPAGAHVARCIRVIDLGTQEKTFQNETKSAHQILITWELPTQLMSGGEHDGKPYTISQRYTASLSPKATLRKILESWRGRQFTEADLNGDGFNVSQIVGKPCLLNIVHVERGDKVYANIASVMQVPTGMPVPAQVNPSMFLSLSDFDASVFEALHDRIKETIRQSPEYKAASRGEHNRVVHDNGDVETLDEDIPF